MSSVAGPGSRIGSRRPRRARLAWDLLGIAVFVVMVFPVFWMVSTAFKPDGQINSLNPTWIPTDPTLDHFRDAMDRPYFWNGVVNSLIIVTVTVTLSITLAFLAAIALAKFGFSGRKLFIVLMIGILMLPQAGLVIPLYVVLAKYHLTSGELARALTGVVITYMTFVLPFAVWTLRGFILGIPKDLEEAAMVDGSSRVGAFIRILLPLAAPGLVATSVFVFISAWNEFIFANVLLSDQSHQTVTVWLSYFTGTSRNTDWGALMAASTLIAIPVVMFFLLLQRRIVFGMTAGAVRGERRAMAQGRAWLVVAVVCCIAATTGASAMSAASAPPLPRYGDVIPRPSEIAEGAGRFTLEPGAVLEVRGGAAVTPIADLLARVMRASTGYPLQILAARAAQRPGSVRLALDGGRRDLADEGYELRVTTESVSVVARRPAGLLYGMQTLRQLLPAAIERGQPSAGPWRIRAGVIRDVPRFTWRGAMLDVARHFHGVEDVKRFIDLMALYKLNTLHLHLSDDQGWRIAIRSWPRLTTVGGSTAVGGGEGGFYTQQQFRDLVAYADRLHVTIVPEIDLPGHTNAALASYATLSCNGVAPALYTGIEVGFSSLCVGKELTYRFVDDVVGELASLTTGPFVHVGGDEAQATTAADYQAFMNRVRPIVRAHGKRMVGWEEVAKSRLPRGAIVQHWHSADLARAAVAKGARLVMAPATKVYLDMKYTPQTQLGLSWAGTTDVKDSYSWDPATQVAGVDEADIVGVEAPLWTETAVTRADVDYLAFPRLIGVAEIAWSPAIGRSWRTYRTRLGRQAARLDELGVRFYRDPAVPWPTAGR